MGITVSCYFAPIILSCIIYFALLYKKRNIPENNDLEENLSQQRQQTPRQNSSEIDNHFEIPGIIIEVKANKANQSKTSKQNQHTQSTFTAAFPHLISFVMCSIDLNFEDPFLLSIYLIKFYISPYLEIMTIYSAIDKSAPLYSYRSGVRLD